LQKNPRKDEQARLRELARRTLEAYRQLNSAAAAFSFENNKRPSNDNLTRAGELLEAVVAEIKGTA
jgi:hypothetical protein